MNGSLMSHSPYHFFTTSEKYNLPCSCKMLHPFTPVSLAGKTYLVTFYSCYPQIQWHLGQTMILAESRQYFSVNVLLCGQPIRSQTETWMSFEWVYIATKMRFNRPVLLLENELMINCIYVISFISHFKQAVAAFPSWSLTICCLVLGRQCSVGLAFLLKKQMKN